MLKKEGIISLIFFLVFVFPLTYQPFHDVVHHGDYHEHHNGLSTSDEKCLVYEYHFASFDIPSQINFETNTTLNFTVSNSFYNKIELELNPTYKATRAPPTKA